MSSGDVLLKFLTHLEKRDSIWGIMKADPIPPSPIRSIATFIAHHKWHVLLLIPAIPLITAIHEGAHAFVAWIQGAQITSIQWIPNLNSAGHVRYEMPTGKAFSIPLTALAPHLLYSLILLVPIILAYRKGFHTDTAASWIYFWCFFIPTSEMGFASSIWFHGGRNDLFKALGPPNPTLTTFWVILAFFVILMGFLIQNRLYQKLRLQGIPYLILVGILLASLAAIPPLFRHLAPYP